MKKVLLSVLLITVSFALFGCTDDNEKPVITINSDLSKVFEVGDGAPDWKTYFSVNDNVDGDITVTDEMIEYDVDMSKVGSYTVNIELTDKAGNTATDKINIEVKDTVAPTITLVDDKVIDFTVGQTPPDWKTYFSVTDSGDGNIQITDEMIDENVDLSKAGAYTVKLTVSDASGNEATKTINISVSDENAPTIAVNETLKTEFIQGDNIPNWKDYFSVEDDADGEITLTDEMIETNVNMNVVGEYQVTVTVTDSSNNEANKTITINVIQMPAPILSVVSNNILFGFELAVSADRKLMEYSLNGEDFVSIENPTNSYNINELNLGKNTLVFKGEFGAKTEMLEVTTVELEVKSTMGTLAKEMYGYDVDGNEYDLLTDYVPHPKGFFLDDLGNIFEMDYIIAKGVYQVGTVLLLDYETTFEVTDDNINDIQIKVVNDEKKSEYVIADDVQYLVTDYISVTMKYNAYDYYRFFSEYYEVDFVYELEDGTVYIPTEKDDATFTVSSDGTGTTESLILTKDGVDQLVVDELFAGAVSEIYSEGTVILLSDDTTYEVLATDESLYVMGSRSHAIIVDGEIKTVIGYKQLAHEYVMSFYDFLGVYIVFELDDETIYTAKENDGGIITTIFTDGFESIYRITIDGNDYVVSELHMAFTASEYFSSGMILLLEDDTMYEVKENDETLIVTTMYGEIKLVRDAELVTILGYQFNYHNVINSSAEVYLENGEKIVIATNQEAYLREMFNDETLYLVINDEVHVVTALIESIEKPILNEYWVGKALRLSDGTVYVVQEDDTSKVVTRFDHVTGEMQQYIIVENVMYQVDTDELASRDINVIYNVGDELLLEDGTTYTVLENDTTQLYTISISGEYSYRYFIVIDDVLLEVVNDETDLPDKPVIPDANTVGDYYSEGHELLLEDGTIYVVVEDDSNILQIIEMDGLTLIMIMLNENGVQVIADTKELLSEEMPVGAEISLISIDGNETITNYIVVENDMTIVWSDINGFGYIIIEDVVYQIFDITLP